MTKETTFKAIMSNDGILSILPLAKDCPMHGWYSFEEPPIDGSKAALFPAIITGIVWKNGMGVWRISCWRIDLADGRSVSLPPEASYVLV